MLIIAAVVIALAATAGFFLTRKPAGLTGQNNAGTPGGVSTETAVEPASGLGGQLYSEIQQNPGTKIPDTNPIKNDLNPYNNGYVNPF